MFSTAATVNVLITKACPLWLVIHYQITSFLSIRDLLIITVLRTSLCVGGVKLEHQAQEMP